MLICRPERQVTMSGNEFHAVPREDDRFHCSIENDILYAVDKVLLEDYMGYVKEDYNFDFDHLDQLTVGESAFYIRRQHLVFGDGEPGPQNYRFKWYDAGNKAETEIPGI